MRPHTDIKSADSSIRLLQVYQPQPPGDERKVARPRAVGSEDQDTRRQYNHRLRRRPGQCERLTQLVAMAKHQRLRLL